MKLGTDSLNVAVSAGIFLYHFTRSTTAPTPGSELRRRPGWLRRTEQDYDE